MLMKAILVYMVTGPVLIVVMVIGLYIGLVLKYGFDNTLKAIDIVNEKYLVDYHNWFEAIVYGLIGMFICWPHTLSELPIKIQWVHEEAKLLMDSRKEKEDS